jgi:3D (Asp-Asp-Asp) domain-containing protein
VSGSIIFVLCILLLFLGGFYQQQSEQLEIYQGLQERVQVEYAYHQHYKRIADERQLMIDKYEAERMITVTISHYTRSKDETDSTPNQSAILTFARPGFTVAVSHDLKYMLGHYIYIYGKGVFYVEDLMNERWTNKIDVLVDTKKEAFAKGELKNQQVVLLGKDLDLYYE